MPPLRVDKLTKTFGPLAALTDVSFAVEPGEVFGYLGPNGAGKTTTLRIILGLVHATAGTVTLFDRSSLDSAARGRVGFLPGDLRLYGDMTGTEALDFFARFRPDQPPVLRRRLLHALTLDEITLQRRIKFLSHGTRQKIGLIIAMQHDPELLLLDEPSNGLDPLVQRAFRELVRDAAARGRAVFFSSHVLSEAEDVCTRVAILREGRIVALESIGNLRAKLLRRLSVRCKYEVPRALLENPIVARSEVNGRSATLWTRGDVNVVVRALAATELEEVVFAEPELEDIFLSYYSGHDA